MTKPLPKFTTHQEAWEVFKSRMPDSNQWSEAKEAATKGLFLAGYAAGVSVAATVLIDAFKQGKSALEIDLSALENTVTSLTKPE